MKPKTPTFTVKEILKAAKDGGADYFWFKHTCNILLRKKGLRLDENGIIAKSRSKNPDRECEKCIYEKGAYCQLCRKLNTGICPLNQFEYYLSK